MLLFTFLTHACYGFDSKLLLYINFIIIKDNIYYIKTDLEGKSYSFFAKNWNICE
jgi:hypothetical protein